MKWFITSIVLAIVINPTVAQTDTTFTYQGRLLDAGEPANGTFNVDFNLWDDPVAGNQIGSTIMFNAMPVTDGLLTAELDFGAAAFDNSDRWLEVVVNGSELTPRQPFTRSPYSIQTRGIFVDENNNVGIGTSNPLYPLHVETDAFYAIYAINTATIGQHHGGRFEINTTGPTGIAVWGRASGSTGSSDGVHGENLSTSGTGVRGSAQAISGTTYGVFGYSRSSDGRGVYGLADARSGTTYGVYALSQSMTGRGVYGLADANSGINYGGWFETSSTSGRALFGFANRNSGTNYGVVGHSNSSSGFDFWASGAGTNYGSPSSRRFKSNVVPIDDPLYKLAQLRGVYFDWDEEHGGHHDVGMIAEEVGEVLPEIVNYEENGIDAIGMDYSKLTPLLVEAVNALRAEVEHKDSQIKDLQARLTALETLVEQLVSNRNGGAK